MLVALIIKIECLVDFNQTFGRLVERLYVSPWCG